MILYTIFHLVKILTIPLTSAAGFFFLTGLETGSSGCGSAAGFFGGLLAGEAASFLGLLGLGATALISTFSLNSSTCKRERER